MSDPPPAPVPASVVPSSSQAPSAPVPIPIATSQPVALPSRTPATILPSPWRETILTYSMGEEHHGQSIKFCPFDGNRVACSTGGDYGLCGPGGIFVLDRDEATGQLREVMVSDYRDNLLDICWSETDPNVLSTAAGDGYVQVWNLSTRFPKVPVHEFKGHKVEMSSVEWSPGKFGNTLLASSWDGTVCTYDMHGPWPVVKVSVSEVIVYQSMWSPHSPNKFVSVAQDGVMQLWDIQANKEKPQIYLSVSATELLSCDWNTYSEHLVVTAGADCTVKGFDLRNYSQPVFNIMDHGHAVRRCKFSPHTPTILASVSYDMSLRIFDFQVSDENLEIICEHAEFLYGLDWNPRYKNELATCAFDKTIKILTPKSIAGM